MSAPMPDFEMPEASERRRMRVPRGPRARRVLGIGVVAVVVATLAIVGVPALVDQQRGRDAVATVERYAADVAAGDVDAVVAAQTPDADVASDALLLAGIVAPSAPVVVDAVELLAVDGPRAAVRVRHAIGPDAGASVVVLVDRGGEWRVVDGLLGTVDVPHELALALGDVDARTGTMLAMITTTVEEPAPGGQVVARTSIANVAFDVVIADDLQTLTVAPAPAVAAP